MLPPFGAPRSRCLGPGWPHLRHSSRSETVVPGEDVTQGSQSASINDQPGDPQAPRTRRWWPTWIPVGPAQRWLAIFSLSLAGLLIRFLVPAPVAQADNRDGPRLMCGLGLEPVTHGNPRFFRFAYFEYATTHACAGRAPYPSSQLVLLEVARLLTPVFGLSGNLNMIALGVVTCVLAAVGIASLAVGLRIPLWAQFVVAAAVWLIVADSAFFDVFAGPFSEPAALVGLLLVAAGTLYLGRGWHATVFGLVLAGFGGALGILSKEQYLIWAAPVCVTLVLATAAPGRWYSLRRFRTREATAGLAVAVIVAVLTIGYIALDFASHYGKRLHYIQAVDMIFTDIVTTRANAPAGLRALGLPASWAKYAGRYYWHPDSVRTSPIFARYEGKLTDGNIAHYLVTHPASIVRIGQAAAEQAQRVQVTTLGDYGVSAGHPASTIDTKVVVFTWLMHQLPAHLGLLWYVPLWAVMTAIAIAALAWRKRRPWTRDGAMLILCMTASAVTGFIPPAYFAGISTTRHMVGTNLATGLAFVVACCVAVSLAGQLIASRRLTTAPGTSAGRPQLSPAGTRQT